MRLIITRGIPASGKSTWRKLYQSLNPDAVVVCRDDIRYATFGRFTDVDENVITNIENGAVRAGLKAGLDVVVDATHIKHAYIKRVWAIGVEYGAEIEVKQFDIDLDEALKRNANRDRQVPEDVIRKMHQSLKSSGRFKPPTPPAGVVPYVPLTSLPKAIVVDVDGTLTTGSLTRSPYDWHRVGEDEVNDVVAELVETMKAAGYKIIVMSGRDGVCQPQTEEWLQRHNIVYDEIHMRAEGDQRRDSIVKRELFDNHVRNNYNVRFAVDDRAQVVSECWRAMGLVCLDVAGSTF